MLVSGAGGTTRRAIVLFLLLSAAVPPAAAGDSTPPEISLTVRGPQGQNGWYVGPVVVNWSVSDPDSPTGFTVDAGCEPSVTLATDTAGVTRECRATSEGGSAAKSARVRIDATAPAATAASPARPPDAAGWFNHAVTVTWAGTDATSGIASCTSTEYGGPDSLTASVAGTCRDRAGHESAPLPFALSYDATPPSVAGASADRGPEPNGWYRSPVDLVWRGTDATAGVAGCTALRYAGPDGDPAEPAGTCTDVAGNVSAPLAHRLRFDATAPRITGLRTTPHGSGARLAWRAGDARVRITRQPGRRGERSSVIYSGRRSSVLDRGLRTGRRYVYVIEAVDPAGNASRATISMVAGPAVRDLLRAPRNGARVSRPPVLRWRAVRPARFYHVQVFRGRRVVLLAWPTRARLALRRRWRTEGRTRRLVPGRYTWYVWAGYGSRFEPRYGRVLGRRTFVVR
jgi:hypothetical protein